ncbi:MAG: hypothetical protein ACTHZX_00555 [Microbacterium sp.]
MVTDDARRAFLPHHEGAPPTPPPGGYQHARRFPSSPFAPRDGHDPFVPVPQPPAPRRRRRHHPLGWIALSAAAVFGLVLLVAFGAQATDAIYGTTMLALQLLVLAGAIGAVIPGPSRVLGAWTLVLVLLVNVGTVGALSALRTSAAGTYDGQSEEQKEDPYPGIRDRSPEAFLSAPSLEDTVERTDRISKAIREELTDQYGYTWVKVGDGKTRPERNGYGGESLLQEYTSPEWKTEQPIRDDARKRDVMRTINAVLAREGVYYSMYPLNEGGGISEDSLRKLYGGVDPSEQVLWEHYTQVDENPTGDPSGPDPTLMYATIVDLSNDDTGQWTARQKAEAQKDGSPLEGLTLMFLGPHLLSEDDREAFEQGIAENPDPGS